MDKSLNYKKLFYDGNLVDGYKYFGCQYDKNTKEATFRVWAPRAKSVRVIGDFNLWDETVSDMSRSDGIFAIKIPNVEEFDGYKFLIETQDGRKIYKSDPYAFHSETHGETNSKVVDISNFNWTDSAWEKKRKNEAYYNKPVNIYECHIGSWKNFKDGNHFNYRKFADEISDYLVEMNYTDIELMGIAEYPFDGSWGYQITGYFAPTSRYGTPEDFAYLVDKLHSSGVGVILDWVPGHFPKDGNGLYEFDGAPLYEPEDELRKEHKEWGTRCFDYGKTEVRSFLISNAMYWLDIFHIDGLRVDAVASMLYLDYDRKQFRPNKNGGNENLEAIEFFQKLNTEVFARYSGIMMIAEESTAWPLVSKPVSVGGLGFNFKWNMGWMNDTLSYIKTDPYFRAGSHNKITFSMSYAFSENYILPISHDEVVHGKGSLISKMPGEYNMKFAGFRNYLMSMFSHPGKKLTFMGTEFAQFAEWNFAKELDWELLGYEKHKETKEFVKILNKLYKDNSVFWEIEDSWDGFEWLVADDNLQNVIIYERRDKSGKRMLAIFNFSPVEYKNYTFGIDDGNFTTILYSDSEGYSTKKSKYTTTDVKSHGRATSITMNIPAMCGIYMIGDYKKTVEANSAVMTKSVLSTPKTSKPKTSTAKAPTAKPKSTALTKTKE